MIGVAAVSVSMCKTRRSRTKNSRKVRDREERIRIEDVGLYKPLKQVPRHWDVCRSKATGVKATAKKKKQAQAGCGASFAGRCARERVS